MIGNGQVGKSSIRTKLIDKSASLPSKSTHGIDTFDWITKINHLDKEIDFKFNIWDFGGQGIFRTVQQFFCTRNSIYLYVTSYDDEALNFQDEYIGFDYWYPFVNAYGFDNQNDHFSPLLHIRNKKDVKVLPLNEKEFTILYPHIYPEFLQVSCSTLENIDRLEHLIKVILPDANPEMFKREYPISWIEVKEEIEKKRRKTFNYISKAEYIDLCVEKQMDEESAEIWLNELNNIGTVIYFGKARTLQHLVIINPEWIKEAAFRVLKRGDIIKNQGVFFSFNDVWKGGDYPKELHNDLTELMLAFEICYKGKDENNKPAYFVPSLFPRRIEEDNRIFNDIIDDNEKSGHLYEFIIKYDLFMPAGLLHKLIVRYNRETQILFKWRDCIIIDLKDTFAEITENWKERQIEFKFKGKKPNVLYRFIFNAIKLIGDEIVDSKFLNPLKFKILAMYKGDYESLHSLSKNPEARELFWFLFEKPINVQKIEKVPEKIGDNNFESIKEIEKTNLVSEPTIWIKEKQSALRIEIKKIVICESSNSYTDFFVLPDSNISPKTSLINVDEFKSDSNTILKKITSTKSIAEWERELDKYNIIRTHKRFLVNIAYVERANKYSLLLKFNKEADIGEFYKKTVEQRLNLVK